MPFADVAATPGSPGSQAGSPSSATKAFVYLRNYDPDEEPASEHVTVTEDTLRELPMGWQCAFDPESNVPYYWNEITGQTRVSFPTAFNDNELSEVRELSLNY